MLPYSATNRTWVIRTAHKQAGPEGRVGTDVRILQVNSTHASRGCCLEDWKSQWVTKSNISECLTFYATLPPNWPFCDWWVSEAFRTVRRVAACVLPVSSCYSHVKGSFLVAVLLMLVDLLLGATIMSERTRSLSDYSGKFLQIELCSKKERIGTAWLLAGMLQMRRMRRNTDKEGAYCG
jgi:hypothetical protein